MAGCAPRPACIVWFENRRSTPATGPRRRTTGLRRHAAYLLRLCQHRCKPVLRANPHHHRMVRTGRDRSLGRTYSLRASSQFGINPPLPAYPPDFPLANQSATPVEWVVIDASPINIIDMTAVQKIDELHDDLEKRGIVLARARARQSRARFLSKNWARHRAKRQREIDFPTLSAALSAFQKRPKRPSPP